MKTRGGTIIKPGAPVKRGKVTRVSKRLRAIKNVEINERLAQRMNQLSKRYEYIAKETIKPSKPVPQIVETEPFEVEEEEEDEEEQTIPEKIMSMKEFETMRKRAIRILDKDANLRSLVRTLSPNSENVAGVEGNGWRTAEEEGLVDSMNVSEALASEGWKVCDFSELSDSTSSTMSDSTEPQSESSSSSSSSFPLRHVWISPLGQWFGRWLDVENERKRLSEAEVKISRVLAISQETAVTNDHDNGIGIPGTAEYAEFLEGARLRFHRDGVWIGKSPWPKALTSEKMANISSLTMKFFEQVLHTVAIRGLEDKLDVGFMNFRERGKGRFDLNPPALLEAEYEELRRVDLNEGPSWIPLVEAMLDDQTGNPIKLIHSGVFMSMPDSDTQVYHTDGVHLSEVCHLPPHAVNVMRILCFGCVLKVYLVLCIC